MKILQIILFGLLTSLLPAQFVTTPTGNISGVWVLYAGRDTKTAPIVYGANALTADPSWSGKIVLVDRQSGGTPIATKLSNVVSAGGLAMIVANDVTGPAPILSIGSGNATPFPVIAVSMLDGMTLRSLTGSVTVRSDFPPPPATSIDLSQVISRLDELKAMIAAPRAPSVAFGLSLRSPDAVKIGARVTYYATADGSPAPTFQWTKNGAPIAGATAPTYVIEPVTLADAGDYNVIASNPLGTATSPAPDKLVVVP